jgi:hypothetical protein
MFRVSHRGVLLAVATVLVPDATVLLHEPTSGSSIDWVDG